MAFYEYKLLDGFGSQFVQIDNFIDIFHQALFYKVLLNTVIYVGLTLGLGFVVPIILALLLDECPKGSLWFRIIFYLPAIMSPLVTLLLWQLLYDPTEFGLLNQLLAKAHLVDPKKPLLFLESTKTAMICIIIPGIWAHAGPGCIIYLAALKVVPEDLYEAVAVDGGNLWHKLRLVTFPALAPLIVINFIGAFIASWQAMQNVFVLTGGGPLNATRVIGIEIWYNAFVYLRFGYSTAMAWILASLLIGFTVMQLRVFSKVEFKTTEGN
jgi:multiple sugar transport system permease protein